MSKSDYKVIKQFCQVLELVGYNRTIIGFVEKEMKRDFASNSVLYTCKKCDRKKHKVLLNHSLRQLPNNKHYCVECFGVHKLKGFIPRMTIDQAWIKVVK